MHIKTYEDGDIARTIWPTEMNLRTKCKITWMAANRKAPASNKISISDAHKISYTQCIGICVIKETKAEFHKLNAEFYCNFKPRLASRSGLVLAKFVLCTVHEQKLSPDGGLPSCQHFVTPSVAAGRATASILEAVTQ